MSNVKNPHPNAYWYLDTIANTKLIYKLDFSDSHHLKLEYDEKDRTAELYLEEDNNLVVHMTETDLPCMHDALYWASTGVTAFLHNKAIEFKELEKAICGTSGWKERIERG